MTETDGTRRWDSVWTLAERKVFAQLDSPVGIQRFLDNLEYSTDSVYRCPRHVLKTRRAHCFDGALFAAAALRSLGHAPCIMDLTAERDDDHVIAVYRRGRHYGAVAKSNYTGLRSREPVYRSCRELALSYFEQYYNLEGEKSLRRYSGLMNLARWDDREWMTSDANLDALAESLDQRRHYSLLTPEQESALTPVDKRTFAAGILGANKKGISGMARRYRKGLPS